MSVYEFAYPPMDLFLRGIYENRVAASHLQALYGLGLPAKAAA